MTQISQISEARNAHGRGSAKPMVAAPCRCIGCGCTDERACADAFGNPCRWLKVSRALGIGICSECVEELPNWKRAVQQARWRKDKAKHQRERRSLTLVRGRSERRICLKCDRKFKSAGRHNRICLKCRIRNEGVLDRVYGIESIEHG